tara:strand:+ start:33030 stop:33533 length:504 start_codon:yes stop_codon:yes gene_type:complete
MLELEKHQIKNLISLNVSMFSDFPVAENFANSAKEIESLAYVKLIEELDNNKELYNLIVSLTGSDFKLQNSPHSFDSPFSLANFINENNIQISEGEKTWINTITTIQESLGGVCCSAKKQLLKEADLCYEDLVNQCDSEWIFVKNIKEALSTEGLIFLNNGNQIKIV